MKPQNFALVVVACIVALGVSIALVMNLAGTVPAQPRFVANVDFRNALPPGGDGALFAGTPAVGAARPCSAEELQRVRGAVVGSADSRVSGPFTHANLSLFLIHGPDTLRDGNVLTLQEALEQNLVVVHEGLVAINNRAKVPVFIQSGDIIKGGCQDRVLPYDQLIPPESSHVPLPALCVEAGRSSPRGQEISTSFQSATEQLPGKALHLAARHLQSQNHVWEAVRQTQLALTRNAGGSVQDPQSQTSLQLTLENERVHAGIHHYLNELAAVPAGKDNVIGLAVAINGQIQSAEIYASSQLFQRLWPKLLRANAVAALAERRAISSGAPLSAEAVRAFLADAETGQGQRQTVGSRTLLIRQETPRNLLFDTCDPARDNLVVHRSFLAK